MANKVYTKSYARFRGVDKTNDPANVWEYRLAEAENIAPDEAGNPWKRTGWEKTITQADFLVCYQTATGVSKTAVQPQRTYYFELHGQDHIAYICDLGVFMYNGTLALLMVSGSPLIVDANRCFFYEANGTAGFYMFQKSSVAQGANNMYLYSWDNGYSVAKVDPYIPTLIIDRDPSGGGTLLEDVNMLTSKRAVQFKGDGSTQQFVLPTEPEEDTDVTVYLMNSLGGWSEVISGVSLSGDVVTITPAPPVPVIDGEDNVRIVYDGGSDTVAEVTDSYIVAPTKKKRTNVQKYARSERQETLSAVYELKDTTATAIFLDRQDGDTYYFKEKLKQALVMTRRHYSETIYEWILGGDSPDEIVSSTGATIAIGNIGEVKAYDGETELIGDDVLFSIDSYSNNVEVDLPDDTSVEGIAQGDVVTSSRITDKQLTRKTVEGSRLYDDVLYTVAFIMPQSRPITIVIQNLDGTTETRELPVGSSFQYTKPHRTLTEKEITYTERFVRYKYEGTEQTYSYPITVTNTHDEIQGEVASARNAFMSCKRATIFGSGLINSVFMSGSDAPNFNSRVWYSGVGDPTYFPDTNYIEVGSSDTKVMGMIRVGEYLGIVKQGANVDASIYLAYPTSFNDNTTYAVKNVVTNVGAISNGSFNVLNDEPMFLSKDGIVAITPTDEERPTRNRSFYINKPLMEETYLSSAVSFVWNGFYILCVKRGNKDGVCYVLDGTQPSSWVNERTNKQFEAYFWNNIPAQCFAKYNNELWFADFSGNLCRFKPADRADSYHDDYNTTNTKCAVSDLEVIFDQSVYEEYTEDEDLYITFNYDGENWYIVQGYPVDLSDYGITVRGIATGGDKIEIKKGVPIKAKIATIADNDGMTHYFKTMQKKGSLVSLFPKQSVGTNIYIKADEKDPVKVATSDEAEGKLPCDIFLKKKVKKYKRLQFIIDNNTYNQTFGVAEIIKSYVLNGYSKKRG